MSVQRLMANGGCDIVSAMRNDPEKGFRMLMDKYKEAVYWHIRRLVMSHDDAQDAAQETFVRIFRSLQQYHGGGSLTAWVYRIATNEAMRMLGRRKGCVVSLDDETCAAPEIPADRYVDYSDLEAVRLQKAILSLPPKQQVAFTMRYYDGLDYGEIAEVTGSTAASAKVNYHIAKDKIVKYMNSND